MKKYLKIIVPLMMISSLALINVANATSTTPVMNWGVKTGDIEQFTAGWKMNLNLPDFIWNNLSAMYQQMYGENVNFKQAYADFNTLPNVFNIKANITSVSNTGYILYPTDVVSANIELKTPNQSTSDYKEAPLFFQGLLNQYSSTLNKYSNVLDVLTNTPDYLTYLNDTLTAAALSPSGPVDLADWYTPNQNASLGTPENLYSLFVPKSFDFTSYINITAANNALNKPNTYNGITYDNYWTYLHSVYGFPTSVNSINSMLAAMGVTSFKVDTKSIYAQFDFSKINQNMLNTLVNTTLAQSYYGFDLGLNSTSTFDQLLTALGNQLGFTITTPTITAAAGVTYDSNGILQNAHVEFSFSTKINGQTVSFSPVLDISSGVHSSIDANWHGGSAIPGYPIWLIGLASLGGMCVVVISMKKKKR